MQVMNKKYRLGTCGFFFYFLAATHLSTVFVRGADIVFDNFDDGDIHDNNPGDWTNYFGVEEDATSGDLVLAQATCCAGVGFDEFIDEDVSIRTQARVDRGELGLAVRFGANVNDGYFVWVRPNGTLDALVRVNGAVLEFEETSVPIAAGSDEDVLFQVDSIGDELNAWYWSANGAPPAAPQLSITLEPPWSIDGGVAGVYVGDDSESVFRFIQIADSPIPMEGMEDKRLQPGDANQDLKFDQLDLVQVQVAAKYLSGQPATWGEGDWDGAPGGEPGNPPAGNGLFDQTDIIAALAAGVYLTGPYAAVGSGGKQGDGQTSIVYNPTNGELAVDAPAGTELTSFNIDSAAGIFTGETAQNLGGSFDNDSDNNIFKATFGSSFGSLSFGNVAAAGLSEEFLLGDLTVIGSLAGGGELGAVDLIYVPEPSAMTLTVLGLLGLLRFAWPRRNSGRCETMTWNWKRGRVSFIRVALLYLSTWPSRIRQRRF
jgi:hypothetical protein